MKIPAELGEVTPDVPGVGGGELADLHGFPLGTGFCRGTDCGLEADFPDDLPLGLYDIGWEGLTPDWFFVIAVLFDSFRLTDCALADNSSGGTTSGPEDLSMLGSSFLAI